MASQAIDLSGGFVPKAPPQGQGVDLSGGFVAKGSQGTQQPPQQGFWSSAVEASPLSLVGSVLHHPYNSVMNVLDAAKQIVTPQPVGRSMANNPNPIISSIGQAAVHSRQAIQKGVADYKQNGLSLQTRRDFGSAIPFVGPVLDKAEAQTDAGNNVGALGTMVGLGSGFVAPEAAGELRAKLPSASGLVDMATSPLRSHLDEPLPGTSLTPRQRYVSARNLGVQLDAADATNSPLLNGAKAVNQHSLMGAPAYDATKAKNLAQLNAATDNLQNAASPLTDPQARGSLVKSDLLANQQALRSGADAGFSALDEMTGGQPVPGASDVGKFARNLLDKNHAFYQKFPSLVPHTAVNVLGDVSKVDDTASYSDMQRMRSNLLEATRNNNDLVKDQATAMLQQGAGALDSAITAKGLTPEQAAVFRDANAQWAEQKSTYDDPSSPFYSAVRTATPESLANGVGGQNATSVQNLFPRISPEAQGAVQRSVMEKLIGSNATGDPKFQNFGTRLYAQPEGYRNALFTPEQNQTLGDVANTTHALGADLNPSGSGKLLHKVGDMTALVSSGVGALTGHVAPLIADAAYNAGQYGLSKVINSPRFTDFLMREPGAASAGGVGIPRVPLLGGGGNPVNYPHDAYGPGGLDAYLDGIQKPQGSAAKGLAGLDNLYGAGKKPDPLSPLYSAPSSSVDSSLPKGARLQGLDGDETQLHTPSGVLNGRYRVVEADDLIPSHDAQTFKPNPSYPPDVQERTYDTSREAQLRVIQQAKQYKPEMTLSDDPTGTNGPPVVTSDGVVLGGNSRVLSTQRLYADDGSVYRDALVKKAGALGFKPEDLTDFDKPIAVREVSPEGGLDGYRRLATDLNKPLTGSLGTSEKAVSMGKNLSNSTLGSVQAMIDGAGKEATLRSVMSDPATANNFLQKLQSDGVISAQERPQYLDGRDGGMTEAGKALFEKALLGKVLPDSYLLDSAPRHILSKVGSSIGPLASLAARGDEWNILPEIQRAVKEHARMATTGMNVDDHFAQQGMFDDQPTPAEEQITRLLARNPNAVRDALSSFAKDAKQSPEGQSSLLGMSGPSAEDAWIKAFGPILQRRGAPKIQDAPAPAPMLRGNPAGPNVSALALPAGFAGMAAIPRVSMPLQARAIPPLLYRGLVARTGDTA